MFKPLRITWQSLKDSRGSMSRMLLAVAVISALTGCSRYQVTLNNQIIFDPPPLFFDFQVEDRALQQCLEQAVIDSQATTAEEVTTLICTYAEIQSLAGIDTFSQLTTINLEHNNIQNAAPLQDLLALQRLSLANNDITNSQKLQSLEKLVLLDLTENRQVDCTDWEKHNIAELKLPKHCR